VLAKEQSDGLCIVAAQCDESVNFVELENFLHLLNATGNLFDVGARGVKDGAALQLNAVDVSRVSGMKLLSSTPASRSGSR